VPVDLAACLAAASRDPAMVEAALALQQNRLDIAERHSRARLRADPLDVAAIRMMAELAARLGRYPDAEKLLARALELAPAFHAARANYVTVLHRQSKFVQALAEAERLIADDPADLGHLAAKAAVLVRTGGYDEAIALYRRILDAFPEQPRLWISLGHVYKTVGRREESVAAYRRAIAQEPTLGDAWWSLANLKTVRLAADDIAAMQAALARATAAADRYHLHFSLGKAFEDAGAWEQAFGHYAEGNRLRRAELPYDAARTTEHVRQSRALLTREAFASRAGGGHPAHDPIFIVGLPRAPARR
jgi:tetratricopeptide (TPR) repeat protein